VHRLDWIDCDNPKTDVKQVDENENNIFICSLLHDYRRPLLSLFFILMYVFYSKIRPKNGWGAWSRKCSPISFYFNQSKISGRQKMSVVHKNTEYRVCAGHKKVYIICVSTLLFFSLI